MLRGEVSFSSMVVKEDEAMLVMGNFNKDSIC